MWINKLRSIGSPVSVRYRTRGIAPNQEQENVYSRFSRITGANQAALAQTRLDLVGAGGLGGEVAHGAVKKGIGLLRSYDFDYVELSNLARQLFYAADIGKPKALALANNLRQFAIGQTVIEGYATAFQEAVAQGIGLDGDLAVVAVDNNDTRIAAADYYLARGTPVIFLAVNDQASRGYVFVQTSQPGHPCFLCLFPDAAADRRVHGCAGASIEMLKIMAGVTLYAVDSLLMARPRSWNYMSVYLDGGGAGQEVIAPRPHCPLCSPKQPKLPLVTEAMGDG